VVVTPLRRRHLRAVTVIEKAVNPHPWSYNLFAGELKLPTSRRWLVAVEGNDLLGFAGLMFTDGEGHLTNIAVHPDHHRRGIGTLLLLDLMDVAEACGVVDMTLEVRASNGAAQSMYTKFGYAPGGIRRKYYRDNSEDAIIMWATGIGNPEEVQRRDAIRASLGRTSAGSDRTRSSTLGPREDGRDA
jgi:ribosomal-protein-alanine N-acetyltransferase